MSSTTTWWSNLSLSGRRCCGRRGGGRRGRRRELGRRGRARREPLTVWARIRRWASVRPAMFPLSEVGVPAGHERGGLHGEHVALPAAAAPSHNCNPVGTRAALAMGVIMAASANMLAPVAVTPAPVGSSVTATTSGPISVPASPVVDGRWRDLQRRRRGGWQRPLRPRRAHDRRHRGLQRIARGQGVVVAEIPDGCLHGGRLVGGVDDSVDADGGLGGVGVVAVEEPGDEADIGGVSPSPRCRGCSRTRCSSVCGC